MWPDDRIQNLFGIELPIIQAPMAGVAFSEMAIGFRRLADWDLSLARY